MPAVSVELGKEGIAEAGVGGLGVEGNGGAEDGAGVGEEVGGVHLFLHVEQEFLLGGDGAGGGVHVAAEAGENALGRSSDVGEGVIQIEKLSPLFALVERTTHPIAYIRHAFPPTFTAYVRHAQSPP